MDAIFQEQNFIPRHIGPDDSEISAMLDVVGYDNLDDLMQAVVPQSIYNPKDMDIGAPMAERTALEILKKIASKNTVAKNYIGQGYYGTITPPVILRNLLENPGWYTAYTPYQPEISQGRLEALINFQQMVIDLTGMEIANASLLDEATAAAEAMLLAQRQSKSKSNVFLVSDAVLPQTIDVLKARAKPLGIDVQICKADNMAGIDAFGLMLQYPDARGQVHNYQSLIKKTNAIVTVATDLMALTLLKPPGEWGADIVFGSSQRFGVPLGFGGPHAAFFATKDEFKRVIPGRIVGVSTDRDGKPAYRLALQTREQHIRRDKATSNICTAQVLLANIAGMYAVWHGAEGLTKIAQRIHGFTSTFADALKGGSFNIEGHFFDTLYIETDKANDILKKATSENINIFKSDNALQISFDETTTPKDVIALCEVFDITAPDFNTAPKTDIPDSLKRTSDFLSHPVFHEYRSETEMLRYLKSLEDKDTSLNRSMIPLGSCTMKLNAAAEMLPVSWSEFSDIHPFAPADQTTGFHELITDLEDMLCKITGFAGVSVQPNSGAMGEYAGLMAIADYHESRGNMHRNICLIPQSAHGTNPASAVQAGMKVVVVDCDEQGNVDVEDLKSKASEHAENLAALMVTYPSTHGVFEQAIVEICDIIHQHGGQVYMDGANLNAMVGAAKPADFGADVMHMNLHKTFCIPHGGGGPGVGPIGVAAHLKPFLPGHVHSKNKNPAMTAAPYGSALILTISWMYIKMMGDAGLKKASQVAVLNANYLARRLSEGYKILYTGKNNLIAHECILDTRKLKNDHGINVDDIAKRLMDFGFHAPTMSWPVVHTLMVEPTESESKDELDRFADAMLKIRAEAEDIITEKMTLDDSPLTNAPHTMQVVFANDWDRQYSREDAAFPLPYLRQNKYWPSVGRVDNAMGDRNFSCTCPPMEEYL